MNLLVYIKYVTQLRLYRKPEEYFLWCNSHFKKKILNKFFHTLYAKNCHMHSYWTKKWCEYYFLLITVKKVITSLFPHSSVTVFNFIHWIKLETKNGMTWRFTFFLSEQNATIFSSLWFSFIYMIEIDLPSS